MIFFFSSKVYPRYKGLEEGEEHVPVQGLTLSLASIESQLSILLRDSLTYVAVVTFQSRQLIEDLALKFEVQGLFNHQHFSWAKALGGLRLNDSGKIFWVGLSSNSGPESISFASCSSLSQESEVDSGVVADTRRRGRPRKQATPQVESQVKRSLRSNNQGYNHQMLPYLTSKTKTSTVKAVAPPEVLQVAEMQRIGVEECLIDPAALTVEKLMKQ
jgi:hypothetical protein